MPAATPTVPPNEPAASLVTELQRCLPEASVARVDGRIALELPTGSPTRAEAAAATAHWVRERFDLDRPTAHGDHLQVAGAADAVRAFVVAWQWIAAPDETRTPYERLGALIAGGSLEQALAAETITAAAAQLHAGYDQAAPPEGSFGGTSDGVVSLPEGSFGGVVRPPEGSFAVAADGAVGPPEGSFGGAAEAASDGAVSPPEGSFGTPPEGSFEGASDGVVSLPEGSFEGAAEAAVTPPEGSFSGAAEIPPEGSFSGAAEIPPEGDWQPADEPTPDPTEGSFGPAEAPSETTFGRATGPAETTFGRATGPAETTFGRATGPAETTFGRATGPAKTSAETTFGRATGPAETTFGRATETTFGKAAGGPTTGAPAPGMPAVGASGRFVLWLLDEGPRPTRTAAFLASLAGRGVVSDGASGDVPRVIATDLTASQARGLAVALSDATGVVLGTAPASCDR
ncbi:MAG: hypothetical protein H6697_05625 [Myxococcales bacterium]|nr:hypothetical protein [Myxococcales bacterium]